MDIKTYICAQIAENPHSGILHLSEPYPAKSLVGKFPKRLSIIVAGLFLTLFSSILNSTESIAQTTVVFSSPGNFSWTPPPGAASFYVEMWGGGGAGSAGAGTNGGGGGSPYLKSITIDLDPYNRSPYPLYIGNGGNAGGNGSGRGEASYILLPNLGAAIYSGFGYPGGDADLPGDFEYPDGNNFYIGQITGGGRGKVNSSCSGTKGGGGGSGSGTGDGVNGQCNAGGTGAAKGGNANQPGASPGAGGGGANSSFTTGGNGQIRITWFCTSEGAGSIGTSHMVPSPQELLTDSLTNEGAVPFYGVSFQWQKSTNGTNWSNIPGANGLTYRLPNLSTTTHFRRATNSCNADSLTNTATIKVVIPKGLVKGKITGKTGLTGISGVTVKVQKVRELSGSPVDKIYSTTTLPVNDGDFSVSDIYFGDPFGSDFLGDSVTVIITPSRGIDEFDPPFRKYILRAGDPQFLTANFKDTSGFSITGKVVQICSTCVGGPKQSPLDSVTIKKNGSFSMVTTKLSYPTEGRGQYAVKVENQGSYTISVSYKNHQFQVASRTVPLVDNVDGIDFVDTTTRVINGRLTDGCNQIIGSGVLKFVDVLTDKNGNAIDPEFIAMVPFDANGYYSVRLPARKYKVSIESFTPSGPNNASHPVYLSDLEPFFNTNLPADSTLADITTTNKVLNLRFRRKPQLEISGLDSLVCGGVKRNFAIMEQAVKNPIQVRVYQGSPDLSCLMKENQDITIFTNIPSEELSQNDTTILNIRKGFVNDTILGGAPNTVLDYTKFLTINYNDPFGRGQASLTRFVLVKGVKSFGAYNPIVTPQLPFMVVHDPAGSRSRSWWKTINSSERSLRFFGEKSNSKGAWAQVKVGSEVSIGTGLAVTVSTTTKAWGTIGAGATVSGRNVNANEAIVSTSISQEVSTKDTPDFVGEDADVFIGASYNLLYGRAWEIDTNQCAGTATKRLMVAPVGFASEYSVTAGAIKTILIPNLKEVAGNPGTTSADSAKAADQIKVWEQVLANNKKNKDNAIFETNRTFSGVDVERSVTSTVSKSNTVEFALGLDVDLAAELGFEVGGSGASGGVKVNFKTETGGSVSNSITQTTEFGYKYADDQTGDLVLMDIKKDPEFGSPVFVTVGGQTSCPAEPNTTQRDNMDIVVTQPVQTNIPADGQAVFVLQLVNNSTEQRKYKLTYNSISLAQVAIVSPPTNNEYLMNPMSTQNISVTVKRGLSDTSFSYTGLEFELKDNCGLSTATSKKARISAFFQSPCSNLSMVTPSANWTLKKSSNNTMEVLFKDYTQANLQRVALEYSPAGANNWTEGFTRNAGQLNNSVNGTTESWNTANLADGTYDIRMKLVCPGTTGTIFTLPVTGVIDRTAPSLFGNPEPADDNYTAGDAISFAFDEKISTTNLNTGKVEMRRLSNNALIPVTVTGYDNRLMIVPQSNLLAFAGDRIRVVVQGMQDLYGNVKTVPDTSYFNIGTFVPASGSKSLQVAVNPVSMSESATGTLDFTFSLGAAAANDVLVNFSIGGTAAFTQDYTHSFATAKILNSFNGAQGTIVIPKNSSSAILRLDPVADAIAEGSETVVVNLTEGGDYALGAAYSATGTFTENGTCTVYAGTDLTLNQNSGNRYLGTGSPAGGAWSGQGVANGVFSTSQSSGVYTVSYCYSNGAGCSACDTLLVTINPPVGKCDYPVITPGTGTYITNQNVVLTCKTAGAEIYYTLSGNNPVVGAGYTRKYTGPIAMSNTATLKAMAVKTGLTNSGVSSAYFTFPVTANPVISPASGVYQGNTLVTITCATAGATIYYTTNGNKPRFDVPNSFTKTYTGAFTVTSTATVWAVAKLPTLQYSSMVSVLITIPPVRLNPGTGTYSAGQLVTMTNTTSGAAIYYTTDGTVPVFGNANTKLYSAPVAVNASQTIRAISYKNSAQDGAVAVGFYTIPTVSNPVFSPVAGVCASPCSITITTPTAGAAIYYTTTGNNPVVGTGFTKLYTGPVAITGATTFKAIGVLSGMLNSSVVTANYTVSSGAPAREAFGTTELSLFPNPTNGRFTLRGLTGEEGTVRIWNASGQLVKSQIVDSEVEDMELTIEDMPSGIYLVDVRMNQSRKTLRIVKR